MLGVPSCQGMEPHLVDGGIYKNLPIWRELEFFMASSMNPNN
jgi:predicted acylesterase/phospholipase RssA